MEKAMAPHPSTLAWKIPWTEEPGRLQSMGSWSQTWLSNFPFTFHFHALEKEMATHFSVLAWRIPGTAEPGGLSSMGLHRVRHDWSDLAAAAGSWWVGWITWTARRANQSILKETNPEYSLGGLMLKLKLQYFEPPDAKSQLTGKDQGQEEKGAIEDKMFG